jgi:hypothetical protein
LNSSVVRSIQSFRWLAAVLVTLGCVCGTAHAQKKSAPAAHASAPAAHASAPSRPSGGGGASHGASTASHGPTTSGSHGATTASHGPTTSNPGGARTTTAGGGRTTTTAGGSRTTTTAGGSRTTGGAAGASRAGGAGAGGAGAHPSGANARAGAGGRPTPAGSHEARAANGSSVRTRANGSRSDVHDAKRGMDIHHGLNGNRRVSVERADHSRIVSERGGRGYVQHPYSYHGHEYGHRAYYDHGRRYDRYYGRYGYRGGFVDVYAPGYYYAPAFYGWAYNPWAAPISYAWGWGGNPWYGYYGSFFTPYPVYSSASLWLTDYLISTSLAAAYQAQAEANAAAVGAALQASAPLTPDIKQMIADEVQRQVALENSEAQQNAAQQDIDPGSSGIARMLSDNQAHVFVAGADLDLVDASGNECAISQGDVIEVTTAPPADATTASAVVLTSKGGKECGKSANVSVAFADLQDMQNHMRETIDAGLGDLKTKQGKGGLPTAPPSAQAAPVQSAYAAVAPPPDPNAASEIQAQAAQADQAEQEVAGAVQPADAGAGAQASVAQPAPPTVTTATIALGQTVDQVTAALGQPKSVVDLGTKKIYVYADMKITFKAGKVSDVQ